MGMPKSVAEAGEEGVVGEAESATGSLSSSSPSSPDHIAIDLSGFEFGVTMHQGIS
jgi:hypothetical protein